MSSSVFSYSGAKSSDEGTLLTAHNVQRIVSNYMVLNITKTVGGYNAPHSLMPAPKEFQKANASIAKHNNC